MGLFRGEELLKIGMTTTGGGTSTSPAPGEASTLPWLDPSKLSKSV